MWRRSIWSFRHLECQNPSIISDSIGIPNGSKRVGGKSKESEDMESEEKNLIHIEEDNDTMQRAGIYLAGALLLIFYLD